MRLQCFVTARTVTCCSSTVPVSSASSQDIHTPGHTRLFENVILTSLYYYSLLNFIGNFLFSIQVYQNETDLKKLMHSNAGLFQYRIRLYPSYYTANTWEWGPPSLVRSIQEVKGRTYSRDTKFGIKMCNDWHEIRAFYSCIFSHWYDSDIQIG